MPLHPRIAALLETLAGAPKLSDLGAVAARRAFAERCRMLPPATEPLHELRELRLSGAGFAEAIAARLYRPFGHTTPLTLFFHGGGFVIGDLDTHDALCRQLAARSGSAVLAVDYRLAPEHPFPAAFDDCTAALRWARTHAAELGVDADRIALAGDSAGGALAAACALRNRDEAGAPLRAQILLYPTLEHYSAGSPSYETCGAGYGLTREALVWFWDQYWPAGQGGEIPPYAAPLRAASHAGLPPTLVVTAEYDPLRDEGERYACALAAVGVDATATRYPGMNHGFAALTARIAEADRAVTQAAAWLSERLR